MDLIL